MAIMRVGIHKETFSINSAFNGDQYIRVEASDEQLEVVRNAIKRYEKGLLSKTGLLDIIEELPKW